MPPAVSEAATNRSIDCTRVLFSQWGLETDPRKTTGLPHSSNNHSIDRSIAARVDTTHFLFLHAGVGGGLPPLRISLLKAKLVCSSLILLPEKRSERARVAPGHRKTRSVESVSDSLINNELNIPSAARALRLEQALRFG